MIRTESETKSRPVEKHTLITDMIMPGHNTRKTNLYIFTYYIVLIYDT